MTQPSMGTPVLSEKTEQLSTVTEDAEVAKERQKKYLALSTNKENNMVNGISNMLKKRLGE